MAAVLLYLFGIFHVHARGQEGLGGPTRRDIKRAPLQHFAGGNCGPSQQNADRSCPAGRRRPVFPECEAPCLMAQSNRSASSSARLTCQAWVRSRLSALAKGKALLRRCGRRRTRARLYAHRCRVNLIQHTQAPRKCRGYGGTGFADVESGWASFPQYDIGGPSWRGRRPRWPQPAPRR